MLHNADVVVAGGSLAAVAAAIRLSESGQRVVLVEAGTMLGTDITATLRPWLPAGEVPDLLRPTVPDGVRTDTEIPLWPDGLKTGLEERLGEAGVVLLYASRPVGLEFGDGRVAGVVIGNKSGRQLIRARTVLDATDAGTVARLAGGRFDGDVPARHCYRATVEFDGVRTEDGALEASLGAGLLAHRGCRDAGHVLVEYTLDLPFGADAEGARQRRAEMRYAGMRVADRLMREDDRFAGSWLAALSHTPFGPVSAPLLPTGWGPQRAVPVGRNSVALSGFAGPLPGIWCLPVAPDPAVRAELADPVRAIRCGTALGEALARQHGQHVDMSPETRSFVDMSPGNPMLVAEYRGDTVGRGRPETTVAEQDVPLAHEVDVLVVGGGSSGAATAISAGRCGARTLVVDANPGLGGTGTYGGVDSYWYGRRAGFNTELREKVRDVHTRLGMSRRNGKWNIEVKTQVLEDAVTQAGARLWTGVTAVGTLLDGDTVAGAVLGTEFGPVAVRARVVVDATGDADIAALAGAGHSYGAARTGTVMWFSLAQFETPGRTRNNFGGAVDVSDVEDYTRAVLAGRRRGERVHDHGGYIATRESRHIHGDVTVTLTDQLVGRCWPDTVNLHFSNHDIKGKSESVWPLVGLIPPNLVIELPYRALLPRGLDGIIVVGKAFSATHDGIAAIRMQADLENLGAVMGIAAAECAATGNSPRTLDVPALQRKLVAAGYLPEEIPGRAPEAAHVRSLAHLPPAELAEAVAAGAPLYRYNDMDHREVHREGIPFVEAVLRTDRESAAALRARLRRGEGAGRVAVAQALTLRGDPDGIRVVCTELAGMLSGNELPRQSEHVRNSQLAPDHAAMPDAAYLLYTLAFARTRRAVALWRRVAELANPSYELMWDSKAGMFSYLDAVCAGAERLADSEAVPVLEKLHAADCLRDQHRHREEPDFVRERLAMLEIALGRALLRCGAPSGVDIMLNYLTDARTLLARQAHAELRELWVDELGMGELGVGAGPWWAVADQLRAAVRPRPAPPDPHCRVDDTR